jgi:hypothetical protein
MPVCDYCDSHIERDEDSQPYLSHLAEKHTDEVSRVDEQKLKKQWNGSLDEVREPDYRFSPVSMGVAAAVAVFIVGLGLTAVVGVLPAASGGADSGGVKWIYDHGNLSVDVNGETVPPSDLDGSEHFYVEDSGVWRMNVPADDRYTVGGALDELGLVDYSDEEVAVAEKYANGMDSAEVLVRINGEPAEMGDTVEDGAQIVVAIEA